MTWRSTALLGVIAALLFGYITFFERHRVADGELEGREARLVERFVRNRVSRIEIHGGEADLVLVRDQNDDGSIGEWRLVEPIEELADESAVGSLLGSLEWSDARRAFDVSQAELADFGLDAPRREVRLRMGGEGAEEVVVRFGNEVESGGGVYLSADGERVKVAGQDVWEAVDHDLAYFRSKRLLQRGVLTATELDIDGDDEVRLRRTGEDWQINGVFARTSEVDEALQALSDLEALSYPEDASLGEAALTIRSLRPRGEDEGEGTRELVVRAGPSSACEREWLVELRLDDVPASACVRRSAFEALRREDWRDRRVVRPSSTDVQAIRIEGGGEPVVVARGEGSDGEASWSGSVDGDPSAVAEWLGDLRRTRVSAFTPCEGEGSHRLVLNAGREYVLSVGQDDTGTWARRDEESTCVRAEGNLVPLLEGFAQRVRPRQLLELESVEGLEITRGGVVERISGSEATGWRIDAPVEAVADATAVAALSESLKALRASRFLGAEDRVPLGEAATIRFAAGDTTHVVEVGESRDGEAPCRLDGGEVFMVSESFARGVSTPLVARDLFSVPPYEIAAIEVRHEGEAQVFRVRDGVFVDAQDEEVDPERIDRLTGVLSQLRMRPIAYGALAAEAAWTVVITSVDEGAPKTFEIAADRTTVHAFGVHGSVPLTLVESLEALVGL